MPKDRSCGLNDTREPGFQRLFAGAGTRKQNRSQHTPAAVFGGLDLVAFQIVGGRIAIFEAIDVQPAPLQIDLSLFLFRTRPLYMKELYAVVGVKMTVWGIINSVWGLAKRRVI